MPALTNPWFGAEFYGGIKSGVEGSFHRQGCKLEGAQGLYLWCPCGFRNPKYWGPNGGRPHAILIPFINPNGPPVPPDHGPTASDGTKPRWWMKGSGLHDLTLTPSVAVGNPECWHGFIQNGQVTL